MTKKRTRKLEYPKYKEINLLCYLLDNGNKIQFNKNLVNHNNYVLMLFSHIYKY